MAQTQTKTSKQGSRSKSSRSTGTSTNGRAKNGRAKQSTRSSQNGAGSSGTKAKARTSNNGSASKGSATKSKTKAKTAQARARSSAAKSNDESLSDRVSSGAQSAADSVVETAKKAKTGIFAAGAAAAGLAATVAISRQQQKRPKVLGVTLPKPKSLQPSGRALGRGMKRDTRKLAGKVSTLAERADKLGKGVSNVASSVKQVSDTAGEATKK